MKIDYFILFNFKFPFQLFFEFLLVISNSLFFWKILLEFWTISKFLANVSSCTEKGM